MQTEVVPCKMQRFQPLETKKWEISPRLNAIITNVWGADQVKDREIIENVWKILPGDGSQKQEVSGQNGRVGISENESTTMNLSQPFIWYHTCCRHNVLLCFFCCKLTLTGTRR